MFQRYDLVKNFPNGDRYVGEATECNVKDGKGTFTWGADKSCYTGEWRKDAMHGRGTLTRRGDSTGAVDGFVYEGTWVQGQRSGKGECRFSSGRAYSGDWRSDHMDGMGVLRGADSDPFVVYEGPFVASLMHGNGGVCTYRNGDRYEGSWSRGLRSGLGVLSFGPTNPNVIQYRGSFTDDRPTGTHGVILYRDGSTFEGAHDNLVRHGHGTWRKPSGETYIGEFHHNARHGVGKLTGASVSMLRGVGGAGASEGGEPSRGTAGEPGSPSLAGLDTCTWWSYDGQWCDDTMHGVGVLTVDVLEASRTSEQLLLFYRGSWSRGIMEGCNSDNVMRWARREYVGPVHGNVPHGPRGEERNGVLRVQNPALSSPTADGICAPPLSIAETRRFVQHSHHHSLHVDVVPTDAIGSTLLTFDVLSYVGAFAGGLREGSGNATIRLQHRPSGAVAVDADPTRPVLRTWYASTLDAAQVSGEWKSGVPHGRISWSWPSQRASYEGPAYEGLPDTRHDGSATVPLAVVKGVFTWTTNTAAGGTAAVARYSGEFRSGLRHGTGRQQYANDDVYDGAWLHDSREGYGRFCESRTGDTYSGNWHSDCFHGHGTHTRYGVATYDGEFQHGLRHGSGTLSSTVPPLRYVGSFERGEFEGYGCLQLLTPPSSGANSSTSGELSESGSVEGTKYEGTFRNGKCHGPSCTETFSSGLVYRGAFVDGATRGVGTLTMVNGDTYEGEVVDGCVKHGKGTMRFADGGLLTATWVNNRLHGTGVHVSRTGVRSERTYVDGNQSASASATTPLAPLIAESVSGRCESEVPQPRGDSAPTPLPAGGGAAAAAAGGLPKASTYFGSHHGNAAPLPLSLKGLRPAAGGTTSPAVTAAAKPKAVGDGLPTAPAAHLPLEQPAQQCSTYFSETAAPANAQASSEPAADGDSDEQAPVRAMTTNILQLTEAIAALDASCGSLERSPTSDKRDEGIRKMQRSSLVLARLRETQRLLALVQGAVATVVATSAPPSNVSQ